MYPSQHCGCEQNVIQQFLGFLASIMTISEVQNEFNISKKLLQLSKYLPSLTGAEYISMDGMLQQRISNNGNHQQNISLHHPHI